MDYRVLGGTGFKASVVALGGCGVGWVDQETADRAIEYVLSRGVNVVDAAPTYGEAEVRLRNWIVKLRTRLFLAEKTQKRDRDGAWSELKASMDRLGVESFDLYQMHAVSDFEDLNKALSRDGAIEAFKEAREVGLIRFIGLTTHDVRIALKALELFEFDTIMIPVGLFSLVNPTPRSDFRQLLRVTRDKNIGVIAIKAIARRPWKGEHKYNTWYEPLEDQDMIDLAVWFTLSQEGVATYSLPCDIRLWPKVLNTAERFRVLTAEEQEEALEKARLEMFEYIY
ncbi:aldo/keto reductase [Candidatus Bathyarchaeota archaeon]|nr:aldo/keto reductase [Candidatus Bathyarchaeota archaeon]